MNQHPDYREEAKRLEEVGGKIGEEIRKKETDMQAYKNEIVSIRKSMWENTMHTFNNEVEAMIEANQYIHAMKQQEEHYRFTEGLLRKYKLLLDSPYFARVDFKYDDDQETDKIYIGLYSFIDNDSMTVLVHDWRAPISSIFYEYETGRAGFETREIKVTGEILLKRQFKIKGSKLEFLFDSSIKIDDEILQEMLSRNASDKMKHIVTTIQKEQNKVIRHEESSILMVRGAAGSGKTSIALHRIAYLLYKDSHLESKNIVIFSPNHIFNDYISNVLPELGEENVLQTTLEEYVGRYIGRGGSVEKLNDHLENLIDPQKGQFHPIREKGYRLKASTAFFNGLKRYAGSLGSRIESFEDIRYHGRLVVSRQEMLALYNRYKEELPVHKCLKIIRERALYLLSAAQEERKAELRQQLASGNKSSKEIAAIVRLELLKELRLFREEILKRTFLSLDDAYRGFYAGDYFYEAGFAAGFPKAELEVISRYTLAHYKDGAMHYEDAIVSLYLRLRVEGAADSSDIKHVVIDEAQDYSPLQYAVFNLLFPSAGFTILGDMNQVINPYGHIKAYEETLEAFDRRDAAILHLSKSYRSTRQISNFAKAMLMARERYEGFERNGVLPKLFKTDSDMDFKRKLKADIENMQGSGMKSIAVICKTAAECKRLHALLSDQIYVNMITLEENRFKEGITLIPSYFCKGLEFDGVILYGADADRYAGEPDRKLLYTICTRALHQLHIYYKDCLTPIIEQIDAGLYDHSQ